MPREAADRGIYHLASGELPAVVAGSEFIYVAVKVFAAHLVIDTVIASLQQSPEALNAIHMSHSIHILADTMGNTLMAVTLPANPLVASVLVRCRQSFLCVHWPG